MTRDDIIRMAVEAGMAGIATTVICEIDDLERFAALVTAAERERCATECERRHANGNFAHDTREDCAEAIRAMKDEVTG